MCMSDISLDLAPTGGHFGVQQQRPTGLLVGCWASVGRAKRGPSSVADDYLVGHVRSMISTIRVCQESTYVPVYIYIYKQIPRRLH